MRLPLYTFYYSTRLLPSEAGNRVAGAANDKNFFFYILLFFIPLLNFHPKIDLMIIIFLILFLLE